jgi:SNF2 family DNA or RNA helicase
MSNRADGSWLSEIISQLNRLGRRDLGDLSIDEQTDHVLPEEVFTEAIALREVAASGATGWALSRLPQESPSATYGAEHTCQTQRSDKTFAKFVNDIGQDYGLEVSIEPDPSAFRRTFWNSVDRGRNHQAGIKNEPDEMSLKDMPEQMKFGRKVLKPYQMQDVGQLVRVDQVQKCPGLLHDMGLGKTIQAIAICEVNWGGPVLIVAPATLRDGWLAELRMTVPRRKVIDYRDLVRGPMSSRDLQSYDYVVVSYQTVERQFSQAWTFAKHQDLRMRGEEYEMIEPTKQQKMQGVSEPLRIPLEDTMPQGHLHATQWYRVVCDEAHNLKGNGKTTDAVCALTRSHGMYISGTPQQNGYRDWFAAFRFARLEPFHNNESSFKQHFVNKQKSSVNSYERLEEGRGRILSLIVRGFCLRRRKEDKFLGESPLAAIKSVQHPIIHVKPDDGSKYPHHPDSEKSCQESLKHHWDKNGSGKATKKPNARGLKKHILAEMTTAMQATAHPAVLQAPKFSKKVARKDPKVSAKYNKWLASFERDPKKMTWRSSVIVAVLDIIRRHVAAIKKNAPDSGGGIVIFARFRPVLDLINIAVRHEIGQGVGCVQFDGRLDDDQRKENLGKFKAQASLAHLILLTTPKMGGEGHNFTEASCIIMVTPHFNPYVDVQAMSRAARPGQTKTVHIWQISMESSFDVRICFVQDRKVSNAEDITEWDKREKKAVMEAKGWTKAKFYDEASLSSSINCTVAD